MKYIAQNLRERLEEIQFRILESNDFQFSNQVKYLFSKIEEEKKLKIILTSIIKHHKYSAEELFSLAEKLYELEFEFENEEAHVTFCYQMLLFLIKQNGYNRFYLNEIFNIGDRTNIQVVKTEYVLPIINYLKDKILEPSPIIYLLEKYKKRTEWFSCEKLYSEYRSIDKNYEKVLENDLRLFLFDQGIEYPLSGAKVGRNDEVDILANVDTDNPIIIEVKVYDKEPPKTYGKNRIKEGFKQSLHYAQKYGKDVYLVIFNMNDIDITFDAEDFGSTFPPSEIVGQKTIHFVVVDIFPKEYPSKRKNPKKEMITKKDLI